MWHKKGGLVVAVQEGEQRINDQSWEVRIIPHHETFSTTIQFY
jgi:hypothetical protein